MILWHIVKAERETALTSSLVVMWGGPDPEWASELPGILGSSVDLGLVQVIQDRLVNPARPILDYLCQEEVVSSKHLAGWHS